MRIFTAIELSVEAIQEIERIQTTIRERVSCRRWQPLKNLHLTLHFLGEVEERKIEPLQSSLAAICQSHSPFRLELGQIGAFPRLERANILWLGLGGEVSRLCALEKAMRRGIQELSLVTEDRPYSPHITLARQPEDTARLVSVIRELKVNRTGWPVQRILLFQSRLHPAGAIYNIIGEYPLI